MHKTEAAGHVGNMFVEEDVNIARPPTQVTGDMLNAFMMELVNVATMNGETLLTPGTDTFTQCREAIITKIQSIFNKGATVMIVRAASTAATNLAAPGATIGGVTMSAGDVFLEKDHATGASRGVYVWNGAAVPATRDPRADTGAELKAGMLFVVTEGTNADTLWELSTDGTITVGTTALTFIQKDTASGYLPLSGGTVGTLTVTGALSTFGNASGSGISIKATGGGGREWRIGDAISDSNGVLVLYDYTGGKQIARYGDSIGWDFKTSNLSRASIDSSGNFYVGADSTCNLKDLRTSSQNANGYQKLPGGVIIQWGNVNVTHSGTGGETAVTFPIAFPTACRSVTPVIQQSGQLTGNCTAYLKNPTVSGFTAGLDGNSFVDGTYTVYWMAIGH